MKFRNCLPLLPLLVLPMLSQAEDEKNKEDYKASTVTDFLSAKYKWEPVKEEPIPTQEVENPSPLKPPSERTADRDAVVEARLQPTLPIDDPKETVPEDERGLDTVELKEYEVNELYSPLMRMSELRDLDTLKPASGGAYLSEEYYSNFENQFLNRWKIPLIGKSQDQLAKERYQQEQYQNFIGDVSNTIEGLQNLNPQLAKELRTELRETQYQYNTNAKTDSNRYTGPEAKF